MLSATMTAATTAARAIQDASFILIESRRLIAAGWIEARTNSSRDSLPRTDENQLLILLAIVVRMFHVFGRHFPFHMVVIIKLGK